MIGDVYILNQNLEKIGIVDTYRSLIWSKRYRKPGDCELYLSASAKNVELLQVGNYVMRSDDDMICRIKRTQITTDVENGNYLTVTGYDVKELLNQRIVWGMATADGNAEMFARSVINSALGSDASAERQMKKPDGTLLLQLGTVAGFTDVTTEQVNFANIGEKVVEWCERYEWGSRARLSGGKFVFEFYRGADRSSYVIFSPKYENIRTTMYTRDATNLGNIGVIGAEGSGFNKTRSFVGNAEGIERYEFYIDGRDLSRTISFGEIRATYPQGHVIYSEEHPTYPRYYNVAPYELYVYDEEHLAYLQEHYPGGHEEIIDGHLYWVFTFKYIATFEDPEAAQGDPPPDTALLRLDNATYISYLLAQAYGKLAEHGEKTDFNGSAEPNTTFVYKQDYFLGDLVTVENEYGIKLKARIVEITEVHDDDGYSFDPIFEYITEE